MRTPRFLFKDKELDVKTITIDGYKDEKVELIIISPKALKGKTPCLIYIHGGGFVFKGSPSHFRLASRYAKEGGCKIIYVKYKLAPKYPFPYQQEEAYRAYRYVFEHADELGVDVKRIALTGDSAGATLSVTSMLIAHDNNKNYKPLFQLLIYPWLDDRGDSQSNKMYIDTPMWNSSLSKSVKHFTNPKNIKFPPSYVSPVEYHDLSFLPPAYIEVAQYDCLHDDGVLYASLLEKEGIPVEFYEVMGTMHGYDTKYNAPTTQKMINKRIDYIKRMFK